MSSSTKEPPPLSLKNNDNPTSQEVHFDDQDDDLLSQAYDFFITQTHSETVSQTTNIKENNIHPDDVGNKNNSFTLNKNGITKDGEMETEKMNSGISTKNNEALKEIKYLEDLVTLEDLVEPIADLICEQNDGLLLSPLCLDEDLNHESADCNSTSVAENDVQLDMQNDISESSTIASILVMEIFGNVFENKSEKMATDIIEEIVSRAWKTIKPRSRWRASDPSSWKVNVARKRRADGLPYVTKKICRQGKNPKNIDCSKSLFKCTMKFSEENRMFLCRNYWNLDYAEKKRYILGLIDIKPVQTLVVNRKRSTLRTNSKRYSFILQDEKVQVCQKFFCQALCISPSVITEAVNKRNCLGVYESSIDPRGKKAPPNKTPPEKMQEVRDHIESFPKMQSHYVRKEIRREYLDTKLSISKMYSLYIEDCVSKDIIPVTEAVYRKIFCTEYNLGFFVPKKDQCLTCTKYERTNPEHKTSIQEEEYTQHIKRKNDCNAEKNKDKERAEKDKKFLSATFDLQAILQIPSDEVGLLYYCRKLTVYNLTIYESALPNEAYCFAWSEVNGKKGSAEIGSILFHYLSKCVPAHVKEVSLFSDTCGGQNRNQFVAALLLWAVHIIDHLDIIEHKFLESGHTYMEVDSMHSSIESAKRHTAIYSMPEWLNVFRRARSSRRKTKDKIAKKPYNVKEMKYYDFLDLKALATDLMKNKNTDGEKVAWLKIKKMNYIKGEMKIYYNYDMSENYFVMELTDQNTIIEEAPITLPASHRYGTRQKKTETLPLSKQPQSTPTREAVQLPKKLKQLYQAPLPITDAKKKDLIKLCDKGVIPDEYHAWFKNLKTESSRIDRVPDLSISDLSDMSDEEPNS